MLKVVVALSAALVGVLAAGCSSGDDANVDQANAAMSTPTARIDTATCKAGVEQTVFSCFIEGSSNVLSACAKDVRTPGGYIEYRFGPANHSDNAITFPKSYSDDSEPAAPSYGLNFEKNGYRYQVFYVGGSRPEGGVNVYQNGNYLRTFNCQAGSFAPFDIQTVYDARIQLEQNQRGE